LKLPFVISQKSVSLARSERHHWDAKESNDKVSWASIQTSVQKGPENNVADALSRIGHHFNITDVSTTIPVWIQEVLNTYAVDSHAQQLLQELVVVSPNDEGYILTEGLIRFKGKIWVGSNSAVQTKIIQALHSSALGGGGGDSGMPATYQRVQRLFCWKWLKALVESFMKQCPTCQQAKHENCKSSELLSPLPIPQGAWQDILMNK
jgi:hypothetical protein